MGEIAIRNNATYSRTYHGEAGRDGKRETLTLKPGLNEGLDEDKVLRIAAVDGRLAKQIEEGDRPDSLKIMGGDSLARLTREVENGNASINSVVPVDEAIKVVHGITSVSILEELYRQCNRVSVRNAITKQLRALGYMGTDIE